jgi:hypothetical protein
VSPKGGWAWKTRMVRVSVRHFVSMEQKGTRDMYYNIYKYE